MRVSKFKLVIKIPVLVNSSAHTMENFLLETNAILETYDAVWDINDDDSLKNITYGINPEIDWDNLLLQKLEIYNSSSEILKRRNNTTPANWISYELNLSLECVEDIIEKIKGHGNRDRHPMIWEFLMNLLVNPETRPFLIKWEDETRYMFRLVRPDFITKFWSTLPGKRCKTKENFTRSLRHHYRTGALIAIKHRNIYQCGPEAIKYLNNIRSS